MHVERQRRRAGYRAGCPTAEQIGRATTLAATIGLGKGRNLHFAIRPRRRKRRRRTADQANDPHRNAGFRSRREQPRHRRLELSGPQILNGLDVSAADPATFGSSTRTAIGCTVRAARTTGPSCFPGAKTVQFAGAFPAAWEKIDGAKGFGQFFAGGSLFSYVPLFAPATADQGVMIAAAPVWYLVAFVPADVSAAQATFAARNLGTAWIASLLLLAALAYVIARQDTKQRHAATEIRALNERLTRDNTTLQHLNHELEVVQLFRLARPPLSAARDRRVQQGAAGGLCRQSR